MGILGVIRRRTSRCSCRRWCDVMSWLPDVWTEKGTFIFYLNSLYTCFLIHPSTTSGVCQKLHSLWTSFSIWSKKHGRTGCTKSLFIWHMCYPGRLCEHCDVEYIMYTLRSRIPFITIHDDSTSSQASFNKHRMQILCFNSTLMSVT